MGKEASSLGLNGEHSLKMKIMSSFTDDEDGEHFYDDKGGKHSLRWMMTIVSIPTDA